jgi:hypothetical protein
MANEKRIKTRVISKHDIEANWNKANQFIPEAGELIVYDVEVDSSGKTLELPEGRTIPYTYERFKIGDGINIPVNLPFAQIQSDWNEADSTELAFINNKPNVKKGTGEGAVIIGDTTNNTATGEYALAEGYGSWALGPYASSSGMRTIAYGNSSFAEGAGQKEPITGWDDIENPSSLTTEDIIAKWNATFAEASDANDGMVISAAVGDYSHVEGLGNLASAKATHAEGKNTQATETYAHAEGRSTKATAYAAHTEGRKTNTLSLASHAEGYETTASGEAAHAEGYNTLASYSHSHAEGHSTQAIGYRTHAEGLRTIAKGNNAHAEGESTQANGNNAHAEGQSTIANGVVAHAEGQGTTASGIGSHAEGQGTTASLDNSHAEGQGTTASGYSAHAEGQYTTASASGAHAEGKETEATAMYAHAEGVRSKAKRTAAHAEGYQSTANSEYAHAEGQESVAEAHAAHTEGQYTQAHTTATASHAEGKETHTEGIASHAEGYQTKAIGNYSHAEGVRTQATGAKSHVEGADNIAGAEWCHVGGDHCISTSDAKYSFTHGYYLNTNYAYQAVFGKCNAEIDALLVVGDGNSNTDRSNAFYVTKDGAYTKSGKLALASHKHSALTIGGKSYNGSSAVSVTASDLGIANAIHFIGETNTALTDGTTTAAVTIDGTSKTPVAGDVVLYGAKEFIWNGSAWKELGDGASHALKTITISAGNGLTGGGDLSNNIHLAVGAGNGITVTADAVAAKAGNGITVTDTGINHADTSSQTSVTANGRKYITGVTLDDYGHVTGLTTGTETVTDTHNSHAIISGKKADGTTNIKGTASSGELTLGDSGVTAGEYGPTTNQTPGYGATFNVPDIKVNAKGIVTSVVNRTVKIPASDNIDTKVNTTLGTTTKAFLLGTTTTPTSTAQAVTTIADTGVYLDTTAGKLTATTFKGALEGNASSATKATKDGNGNVITTTYVTKAELNTSAAKIIDVTSLPTSSIKKNSFYRLEKGVFLENQLKLSTWNCIVVDTLPTTGTVVTTDMKTVTAYYNKADGTAYGYVNSTLATQAGVTAGWYPLANLAPMFGLTFAGVITKISDDPRDSKYRLILEQELYTYDVNGWTLHKSTGQPGAGDSAEIFNHPSNRAEGIAAHAEGYLTNALKNYTHAEGYGTTADGRCAHAEGADTSATGDNSHTEGIHTTAEGSSSHAEGYDTHATANFAHSEGENTRATQEAAHAEGYDTTASGYYAHAEGQSTKATGNYTHSEGIESEASGVASHVEGWGTIASGETVSPSELEISSDYDTYGNLGANHAEGFKTEATGAYSHAEGYKSKANRKAAHAEGWKTFAGYSSEYSYPDGDTSRGEFAHAEGEGTQAINYSAHAEGHSNIAAGTASHVGGEYSEAKGLRSFAHGAYVNAKEADQVVFGKYNADNSNALFIIGNGTSDTARTNLFEITTGDGVKYNGNKLATEGWVKSTNTLVNATKASRAATYTKAASSKFYAVQLDSNNKLGVYVPWEAGSSTTCNCPTFSYNSSTYTLTIG